MIEPAAFEIVTVPESGYPDPEPNKGGRPSLYTPELIETICERLSKGEPLTCICRSDGMPHPDTVRHWMDQQDEVFRAIACAREAGFDSLACEALQIADTPKLGVRIKHTAEGPETWEEDMLGHRKLQVETRLKLLAKWDPRRYGDKIELSGNPDQQHQGAPERGTSGVLTQEILANLRERRKVALAGRQRIGEKGSETREALA